MKILELNYPQRLTCHKPRQPINQPTIEKSFLSKLLCLDCTNIKNIYIYKK